MKLKKDERGRPIYKPEKGKLSRWPKGVSGNLKGRKKGHPNNFSIADLKKAIKFVEQDEQEQFLTAWIKSAWRNPKAMSNVINYMLPQLKSIEGFVATFESAMDDDLAKSIQKKLRDRMKGQS